MNKRIVLTGILLILITIILGAFGAHGLKQYISTEKIASFEVGVRYQMYIGLALLIVGLSADKFKSLKTFFLLEVIGISLFSGSIYLLSIQEILGTDLSFLGPITPLGGLSIIIGWFLLFLQLVKKD